MNIEEMLLVGQSKKQCDKIVKYIGHDKKRFAELMHLFFTGEWRITQRAALPMNNCVKKYPDLINPYFNRLINNLRKKEQHNAVPRNIVRLLQDIEIPKKYHGKIMSICFDYIQSNETAIAIKAFSLTVLENLSKQYPEIFPELKLIIEERWEHETAAFRSRARKILKRGS
ncbi:MAG: hypothetical protein JST75_07950 [Bacteroidetes bacterium]|nr:hypothetical protein [Bacteroidota bacterium]